MTKKEFFTFHQIKNHINIWLNGSSERLSLKAFIALPDNLNFNVDGSTNDYRTEKGLIKVIR